MTFPNLIKVIMTACPKLEENQKQILLTCLKLGKRKLVKVSSNLLDLYDDADTYFMTDKAIINTS